MNYAVGFGKVSEIQQMQHDSVSRGEQSGDISKSNSCKIFSHPSS